MASSVPRPSRAWSAAAGAVLAILFSPAAQAATAPVAPLPDRDARASVHVAPPAQTGRARAALARRLGPGASAETAPSSGALHLLQRTDGMLTGPAAGDPRTIALDYVRAHEDVFGLDAADLDALRLAQDTTSPDGLTHLAWAQTVDGIPVYGAQLRAHLDGDGRLASFSGDPLPALTLDTAHPALDPSAARARAAALAGGDIAGAGTPRLVAFPVGGAARLAWRVTAAGAAPYVYEVVIDAGTGDVLRRRNLTDFANAQIWPRFPGAPNGGGTVATVPIDRTVNGSAWLNDTAGGTRLFGNNAHVYTDVNGSDSDNAATEDVPSSGGGDWLYPLSGFSPAASTCPTPGGCSWDPGTAGSYGANRRQNATQVFYFVNTFHDHLAAAPIGFDEASGNFQADNLGRGGVAGDPLLAEPDDTAAKASPSYNNANMSTPPDGQSPRMQMYLFKGSFNATNGGDVADIVYHEYTHGLSNRLVSDLDNLEGGAMGEAWSDWYAFDFLNDQGYAPDTAASGELDMGAPYLGGTHLIRTEAIDCAVGASAAVCPGTTSAGSGGYTYGDVGNILGGGRYEVHADGEVWGQTLWDLRRALGSTVTEALVTGGMRLSPQAPGFLDERDAILQEDVAAFGGVHEAAIWAVFAGRGMGYAASYGSEDFSLPPALDSPRTTVDDAPPLGDGDGALEPGEAARLTFTARNLGPALPDPVATLTSADPAAALVTRGATAFPGPWGSHTDAASQTPTVVAVPATAACATTLPLSLAVGGARLSPPVTLGAPGAPVTLASSSAFQTITDADAGDLPRRTTSTLTVPAGAGPVSGLSVGLSIAHTWDSDLIVVLTHAGRTATLVNSRGADGDNFTGTVFSDAAGTAVGAGTAPFSGAYRPESPLSAFDGTDASGTWTLRLFDQFHTDQGTLTAWSLRTPSRTCSTPASALPLAGTGAASYVGGTTARLGGTVDPRGAATTAAFDLGPTTGYGTTVPAGDAGSGTGPLAVAADTAGLTPDTTYHYRALALRGSVPVAVGPDRTFTTGPAGTEVTAPPLQSAVPAPSPDPAPSTPTPTTAPVPSTDTTSPTVPATADPPAAAPGTGATPPSAPRLAGDPGVALPRAVTTIRLDRRRRLAYRFTARPAATGSIAFTMTKRLSRGHQVRRVVLSVLPWAADARGRVTVRATLSAADARLVARLQTVPAGVTVTSGTRRYVARLRVRPPLVR